MEFRCPRLKLVFSSVAFAASVPDSFAVLAEAEFSEVESDEAVLQPAKAVNVSVAAKRAARILFFIFISLSKCVDQFIFISLPHSSREHLRFLMYRYPRVPCSCSNPEPRNQSLLCPCSSRALCFRCDCSRLMRLSTRSLSR